MWYQFKQGVADWIHNHKSDICEYNRAKLEFRHPDVLRMAYVIQKLLRALAAISVATNKNMCWLVMELVKLLWVQRFAAGDVKCIFILRTTSFCRRTLFLD